MEKTKKKSPIQIATENLERAVRLYRDEPDVIAARQALSIAEDAARAKHKPEVDRCRLALSDAKDVAKTKKKPRIPENTPENVLSVCKKFWSGTTESWTYRIHAWNAVAVWTSYPAGGYTDNGGWNPTPACYYLLSLTETQFGKPKELQTLSFERNSGKRVTPAMMQAELDKLTHEKTTVPNPQ